jgi:hypothetical protein
MRFAFSALAAVALLTASALVRADDAAFVTTAQKTAQAYGKAVVSLTALLKVTPHSSVPIGAEAKEQPVECVGTVIDAGGLVVTALSALDAAPPSIKLNAGGQTITIDLTTELRDIKYRLPDATEIKGRLVLKDEELDLAFIAPEQALSAATRAALVALPLTNPAAPAKIVDRTINLSRMGKAFNYAPTVSLGRIAACVAKPRLYYLGGSGLGQPVFNDGGQVLGLVVGKPDHEPITVTMMRQRPEQHSIILPIAEVAKNVAQAKEEAAKPVLKETEPATAPAPAGTKPAHH